MAGGMAFSSLVGAAAAFVLSPLRRSARPEGGRLDLGPVALFDPTRSGAAGPREVTVVRTLDDGYMTRRVSERIAVIRDPSGPGGLAALSTTCTHLGCGVTFHPERNAFLCPCHGGVYAPDGTVLAGPPPRPLARLPLVVEGGRVALDVSRTA